jgi:hypothetical protein
VTAFILQSALQHGLYIGGKSLELERSLISRVRIGFVAPHGFKDRVIAGERCDNHLSLRQKGFEISLFGRLATEFPQTVAQFTRVPQVILFEEPKRLAAIGPLNALYRGLIRIGCVMIELNEILQKAIERCFRTYRCHHQGLLCQRV